MDIEQLQYDKRVMVQFQPNAWCDEEAMEQWVKTSWKQYVKDKILLVLDLQRMLSQICWWRVSKNHCARYAIIVKFVW